MNLSRASSSGDTLLCLILLTLPLSCRALCPEYCQCNDTTVTCSGLELSQLPRQIPHDTTELDLSHNRLRDASLDDLDRLINDLTDLEILNLKDNIFTSFPGGLRHIKIDLSENPLHCDCTTLELPNYQFLLTPEQVQCASTSVPQLQNVYLFSLSRNQLQCDDSDLMVPAELTLYKTNQRQEVSCSKPKSGTVYWLRYGEIIYDTADQDCSMSIRFMNSRKTGLYEVRYETPFDNITVFVKVLLEEESLLPQIDNSGSLVEVPIRGTTKLTCTASGIPPPKVEWFFNDHSVTKIIDEDIILVDEATLIVTEITAQRVFTCIATNFVGRTEAEFGVKPVDGVRGAVFAWLAPLSVTLLIITGAGSVAYVFYSKQKLAVLKQRCSSPGVSSVGGTIFENSDAFPSTIIEGDGYKMITISTTSPPHQFICPITRDCMKNPVVASDGFSYEEKAILAWFRRNGTSPMTNGEINKRLIQNHNLRTLIRDIMDKTSVSDSFVNIHHLTPVSTDTATQLPPCLSQSRITPTARVTPNNLSEAALPRPLEQVNSPIIRTRCSRASGRSIISRVQSDQIITSRTSDNSTSLRSPDQQVTPRTPEHPSTSRSSALPSIDTDQPSNYSASTDVAAELSNVSMTEDASLTDNRTSDAISSTDSRRLDDELTISSGIGSSISLDTQMMSQEVSTENIINATAFSNTSSNHDDSDV